MKLNTYQLMNTYELNGGYNYGGLIEVQADTIEDAAAAWYDRWASNGQRMIDGVLWPVFGDMPDDDYAVINYDNDDTMTRAEILAMFD